MKKLLSTILALCLLVSAVPLFGITASAEEYILDSADGKWSFYANDDDMTAELSWCEITGYHKNLRFPDKITGENGKEYTVDRLNKDLLNNELIVDNLIIPNTITEIGEETFGFNKSIKTVTVEDGELPIIFGGCAFYYCPLLNKIDFGNRETRIYSNCFSSCPSLKSVVLPKNVEFVDFGAFDVEKVYVYNSDCRLEEHCFEDTTVIYGIENSTAQQYATENECKFKKLVSCTLKSTEYTYNGKNKKPEVTVKDYQGNTISKDNYIVYYQKNSKKIGEYKIKIDFTDCYSGTITKKFTIVPPKTKLSEVESIGNGCTLKWKKQSKQTDGYKIQYSTNKKFNKNKKSKTINDNASTSVRIDNLKKGKKYYVRICTFKTTKVNGKKVKICSKWSSAKSVKLK